MTLTPFNHLKCTMRTTTTTFCGRIKNEMNDMTGHVQNRI